MRPEGRILQDYNQIYTSLNSRWHSLCSRYLPVTARGSIWRYSRESKPDDQEQGWKLHVAATILTAADVLETVSPFLRSRGLLYKAPVSLYELQKLNSGHFYGYSQVGKFLTIYPESNRDSKLVAAKLYQLTKGISSPTVPFDFRYRPDGCIYYRYGAFKPMESEDLRGESVLSIREPGGQLVPDDRYSRDWPRWASHPFNSIGVRNAGVSESPLRNTFKAFRALSQRGKGGVYEALDLSVSPARLCILKEGRKDGEVDWDGREGFWRIRHEGKVLTHLSRSKVNVPKLYSSFETTNNYYLAMERITGKSLNQWLAGLKRRISIRQAIEFGISIAEELATIHAAGWVWRDCKPGNIILTDDGCFRPVDFEGACRIDKSDSSPWGTRSYVPPEWDEPFRGQSRLPEDLYALGAVIHFMVSGVVPDANNPSPLNALRRNVPERLSKVVQASLNANPEARPEAIAVARRLRRIILK